MNCKSFVRRAPKGFAMLLLVLLAARTPPVKAADSSLAPIRITPERRQLIGLTFAIVQPKDVSEQLEATGTIETDERLQSYVQARFAGWIAQVFANQTYQYVRKGQPLFTIYSPDLDGTEQEYLIALDARRRAGESSVASVIADASSLVDAAVERLKLWGVSPREIARLERERTVRRTIEIDSPATGYIVERNALPNLYVQPETRLFTITDLSKVWVYAAVFQNEIGKVRPGDRAAVKIDAYPGQSFAGHVDFIWPQIDPMTRTARVRCEFDNRKGLLFPGMFGEVALSLAMGRQTVIPATAVLQTGTRNLAFIERADGYLAPAEVELGPRVGDEFVVLRGVDAGQRIVKSANFLIDSESQLEAAAGAFVSPVPGVAATAGVVATAAAATIAFTSDPDPLTRGHNRIEVTLRDSQGQPITGAKVTVTFYMAAMPAMGMTAMRDEGVAEEQGGGVYGAGIDLESGGTWRLTIVASKGGRTIAAKQMDVSATGPMSM